MVFVEIVVCGFVVGALENWWENNNPDCKIFVSDPPKGMNDDLSEVEIAFV